ncbi:hypothetical protein D3C71_1752370 [compost metagenome]
MAAVIEVEPPVQKTADVVQVKLDAQNTITRRRLSKETVGHLGLLHAAVIGPQARNLMLKESVYMVGSGHWRFHQSLPVKRVV